MYYTHKMRVTVSQVGPDGVQTLAQVVRVMQDTSQLWIESEPEFQKFLNEHNLSLIVTSRQVDVERFARYGENIVVKTGVSDCNGFFGDRNTAMFGEDGSVLARSFSLGVFGSRETGRPVRLPQELIDAFRFTQRFIEEPLDRKIVLPQVEPVVHPPISVLRADIDFNKHVNNAQYIQMALEYLPAGMPADAIYHRLRVEYKLPAKYGDIITPCVYDDGSGAVCVELRSEVAGKPYAVVEFSQC